jgi:hypothetical protein
MVLSSPFEQMTKIYLTVLSYLTNRTNLPALSPSPLICGCGNVKIAGLGLPVPPFACVGGREQGTAQTQDSFLIMSFTHPNKSLSGRQWGVWLVGSSSIHSPGFCESQDKGHGTTLTEDFVSLI